MQLSLLKGDVIHSCVLPDRKQGQYWITQNNDLGHEEKVISVEGVKGNWMIKSNRYAHILDEQNRLIKETIVQPLEVYRILSKKTNETFLLYAEPVSNDRKTFTKVQLPLEGKLLIGRSDDCDIQYKSRFVSSNHAELRIKDHSVTIKNLSQSNGTYVNDKRVQEKELQPGDMIYIIGLKIIIGNGFIAINNPDNEVTYNRSILREFHKKQAKEAVDEFEFEEDEASVVQTFYRSPRFKREIDKPIIEIDSPPALGNMEETPLMLMLGPSVTMGLASLVTAAFSIQYAVNSKGSLMFAIPTLVMSLSMLLGSILWPLLTRRHERKKRNQREELRQQKYKQYLEEVRARIKTEISHQSEILHENYVPLSQCTDRIQQASKTLWERTSGQNDFLTLRLGLGDRPLQADIKFPEKRFSLEDDNLQDALISWQTSQKYYIRFQLRFH